MNALLGFPALIVVVSIFAALFEKPWPQYAGTIALVLSVWPIGYICVSSIQNRVSLIRGRQPLPVKGAIAVRNGVINLVLLILVFSMCLWLNLFHK
jgi:hypothetical protein